MVVSKIVKSAVVIALLVTSAIVFSGLTAERASGIHRPADSPAKEPSEEDAGTVSAGQKEKKIKYWVAPMDPTYIRNKPGKSPMGMDLVPVYEDESGSSNDGAVSIDPVTVQSMGVRTTTVSRSPLKSSIRTIGQITYDEERVTHIHTKVSGWVEELFVKTTGEQIVRNQKLLSIYSPELVATEQEYLQALSYRDNVAGSSFPDVVRGAETLLQSTKKRLLLMDISPEQIKSLEERGQVETNIVLRSPATGIVIQKQVFEGMKVSPGMDMYTIADISRVWVLASIYEYELPFVNVGQETEMTLPYEPGTSYRGKVTFIYPYLSPKTRTVQVRMEFDNPDLKLKPEMYADVVITKKISEDVLQIPSEAILRTGYRNIVITSLGKGKFLPKAVEIGPEGEGMTQILSGLTEGETIVTSGQFLIDSESNLKEAIHKMLEAQAADTVPETRAKDVPKQAHDEKGKTHTDISSDQKVMMNELISNYLAIHGALIAESVSEVAEKARTMSATLKKMKSTNLQGTLKDMTASLEDALPGLLSEDLQAARGSFKTLSRTMVDVVKGPGREEALSSGIKLYFCPMEEERWIQKGTDLKNPYLGKDMWICGTEEAL